MNSLIYLLLFLFAAPIHGGILLPTKPSSDSFYTPPSGYESAANGDILQIRKTPRTLINTFAPVKVGNSWQLLIKSEDSFGNPNAIVTTILEPANNPNASRLVSYQVYEDSANINCAPSYAIQAGSDISTIASQTEMYFIAALLEQGYYVTVPDYEGPKSTFTVGRQSGQAVLNAIRGSLHSGNDTGINEDAEVVMWGYSGGSLASGWAAALQPAYAPELSDNLLGAALGGFVTNITATAEATDGTVFAGIIANSLGGLGNEYPEFKSILNKDGNILQVLKLNQFDDLCLANAILVYLNSNFFSGLLKIFNSGWGLLNNPTVKQIVEANGLVYNSKELVPKIPVFIYHGSIDKVVPIVNVKKTYQNWCDAGISSLEFAEDATNGHVTETIVGAPAALTWIIGRFNNQATVTSKCPTRSNHSYWTC
ncbi:Lipase 4 [Candida maltosa Xu316]|uniref:Lipase n=1 Tax=Candida maltosa (strain Xu316) TaxID=1245528 RepID=M3JYU4_CANMX|nr:Lipase 4 [Candida maltosa Xu316]